MTTNRLSMYQPPGGSQARISTAVNDNLDILDSAVGAQVYTASTLPASGFSGKQTWDSTNNRLRVQTGTVPASTWRDVSVPVFSTLSGVSGTHTGEIVFSTADNTLNRWTGSAWTAYTTAASTITAQGGSYTRLATQACANNTDVLVTFDTVENSTSYVTHTTPAGSLFTANVTGWYMLAAQAHWDETVTGVGRRDIHIINGANSNIRYATQSGSATHNGVTGTATGTQNCSQMVRLTSGSGFKVMVNQNQGTSLNLKAETYGVCTRVSFVFLGA